MPGAATASGSGDPPKRKKARRYQRPLKVHVTEEERGEIQARAEAVRLSTSSYLRELGLGFEPAGIADLEVAKKLLELEADLGRLGGLLKAALSPGVQTSQPSGISTGEFRRLLRSVEDNQGRLGVQIARLIGDLD